MIRFRFLITLLFLLVATGVYGQDAARLLHTSFASRELVLDSLFHTRSGIAEDIADPAFFSSHFREILAEATKEDDRALLEHLRLEQFRYDLKMKKGPTPGRGELDRLIQSFHTGDRKYFIPAAQHAYANRLTEIQQDFGNALELYISAYYTYELFPETAFPFKKAMLYDIALAYYRFHDFGNTIKYISLALDDRDTAGVYSSPGMINTLALSYREIGQYDTALYYFRKIQAHVNGQQDWNYITRLNIGQTYLLQHRFTEAAAIFRDCYLAGRQQQINHMTSEAGLALGEIACRQGHYPEAEQYVRTVIALWQDKFGPGWHYQRMESARQAYWILAAVYAGRGDYRPAYYYRDTFLLMKDSLASRYNALKLSGAQNNVQLARFDQEAQRVMYERRRSVLIRNILLVFIALAAVISLLVINNQRLRRKKLEADKRNAGIKLEDFTRALQQKTELVEQFSRELERYREQEQDNGYQDSILKLRRSTILTDEEWVDFREVFEQVHKGFLNRLRMKMPDLTPAEIRFMVLSKLKFSPKDMANILGVGPSAIRKYRYRLRNKLDLPEDGSIDEVVDMI